MNDQSLNMGQSQILQIHQNNVFWPHRPPPFPPDNAAVMFHGAHSHRQIFNAPTPANPTPPGRVAWMGKDFKPDKRNEFGRNDPLQGPGYKQPGQIDSQAQNRLKSRRFHRKNKFESRYAPFAPRNTTSFLMHSKRSRGNATPCPVTPAVLPTPILSPLSEFWIDMAKEEWGVDGYGSMKGLIRLRSGSPRGDEEEEEEEEDDDDDDNGGGGGGGSSDSDVEERVEVEKRLDHDLSRFEMIYPNVGTDDQTSVLENRVDEQDSHITRLEEENMTLKEKLFLMERELDELRRRVQCLETNGVWRACRGQIGKNEVFSEQSVGNVNGEEEEEENDNGGAMTTYCGKLSVH
ncbi:uncharacterized protein LOC114731363 [Neltuma alba]|uniref:uncharacterized protein LOC114731363 n=1 Tax=Neltuma alba TaxID=207710 RepID=UPI0010A4A73A|nr:uncharacterized protein LOC114731363 [Prosopis alba]